PGNALTDVNQPKGITPIFHLQSHWLRVVEVRNTLVRIQSIKRSLRHRVQLTRYTARVLCNEVVRDVAGGRRDNNREAATPHHPVREQGYSPALEDGVSETCTVHALEGAVHEYMV